MRFLHFVQDTAIIYYHLCIIGKLEDRYMETELTYHLEGVIRNKDKTEDFEGPLTLILMLLSKNKIEIRDIQISVILEQYLAYLDEMKAMDLEIASEFVQMASHLLYIKSKMLLASEDEAVSELELLIASLEQLKSGNVYTAVKAVLPDLLAASALGGLYGTKQPEPLPGKREYGYRHESWELLQALSGVLLRAGSSTAEDPEEQARRRRSLLPRRIVYSVRDKSREILLHLRASKRLALREFYSQSRSRSEVVATFVSVLELCSLGRVSLEKSGGEFILSFVGGDIEEILEQIGE